MLEPSGSVAVRRAVPDDAAQLARVAAQTFPLACPPSTLPESIEHFIRTHLTVDSFRDHLADPERVLFIAEAGGAPAGYAMVVFGEPSDADAAASITVRPTAELSKLYVVTEHHGAGVAAALLDASVEAAVSGSARGMWLGTNQGNARANRFYEKHGFTNVGAKRFLVGERWEDDFVLERRLRFSDDVTPSKPVADR